MAYSKSGLTSVRTTVNNTAGAGTTDTIATFAGASYATDAATILNNFNQLAQRLILLEAALKAVGAVKT
jgi:hypothetical protein